MSVPTAAGSKTRPAKRRSRAEMEEYRASVAAVLKEIQPATVRQLFYQLVNRAVIEKIETAYKSLDRNLTIMRRTHQIPFGWLADNTRWMRKPRTYGSLQDMLETEQRLFRRALWDQQDCYVEIWLEKDALAGVLCEITEEWDAPLMVTRGYPSLSFLYSAARAIAAQRKPAHLYYFGDWDPSGKDITRAVEKGIRECAPHAEIYFQRVAVTEEQIQSLPLPTRPTKASDSRKKNFDGDSVEVDAIPPDILRRLVHDCIVLHIDEAALKRLQTIETEERRTLAAVIDSLPEFQATRLTVRELPTASDKKLAAKWGMPASQIADRRVLRRDAPDLLIAADKSEIAISEAMLILQARKRENRSL